MRETYHGQLDLIVQELVDITDKVAEAVRLATQALLEADLKIAEQVISDDAQIDEANEKMNQQCFTLLARQAPVAGELRTIVAAMRMVSDLARMGDLAAHVAKVARLRYPEKAVPADLIPNFTQMARVAQEMVANAGHTLSERNARGAARLADSDDEMDELRRLQFRQLMNDKWPYSVESAVDVALLGRYYERIADHAVIMAGRVIYLLTGEEPEGGNWSIS